MNATGLNGANALWAASFEPGLLCRSVGTSQLAEACVCTEASECAGWYFGSSTCTTISAMLSSSALVRLEVVRLVSMLKIIFSLSNMRSCWRGKL